MMSKRFLARRASPRGIILIHSIQPVWRPHHAFYALRLVRWYITRPAFASCHDNLTFERSGLNLLALGTFQDYSGLPLITRCAFESVFFK
jgi:hypothetical protein